MGTCPVAGPLQVAGAPLMAPGALTPTPTLAAALGLALLTATALLVTIHGITEHELQRARDWTLLGLLVAAAGALTWAGDAWLGAMALSFALHWRSTAQLPSLVCWIGIAGAWMLATRLAAVAR